MRPATSRTTSVSQARYEIDRSVNTLYVVAATQEVNGGTITFPKRLHGLDLATGAEIFCDPVMVDPQLTGTGIDALNGMISFKQASPRTSVRRCRS